MGCGSHSKCRFNSIKKKSVWLPERLSHLGPHQRSRRAPPRHQVPLVPPHRGQVTQACGLQCVYARCGAPPCLTLLFSPERRLFNPWPISYQAVRGPPVGFRSSWFIPDTSPLPDASTGPPPLLCLSRNKRFSFWGGSTYPYVPSWFVFLYHKDHPSFLLEVSQLEILYTGRGPVWVSFCIYGVRVKLVSHIWTRCCQ